MRPGPLQIDHRRCAGPGVEQPIAFLSPGCPELSSALLMDLLGEKCLIVGVSRSTTS
jgi:hypothetical protein